jgi:hypothetical protein
MCSNSNPLCSRSIRGMCIVEYTHIFAFNYTGGKSLPSYRHVGFLHPEFSRRIIGHNSRDGRSVYARRATQKVNLISNKSDTAKADGVQRARFYLRILQTRISHTHSTETLLKASSLIITKCHLIIYPVL